jgi:uncharacterized protein (DUF1800 family)
MPARALSRRAVLQGAGAAGLAGALGGTGILTALPAEAAAVQVPLSASPALHAARRLSFGPNATLVSQIAKRGTARWLEEQMAPAAISDTYAAGVLKQLPAILLTADQIRDRYGFNSWEANQQLRAAVVARAVWSSRHLQEVMHDFWSNHFYVNPDDAPAMWCKIPEDRRLRAKTFTTFHQLLYTSATSPAMLGYLNNAESSKDDINENYGRELLELHTVGLDAGYTERDVRHAALAMTGWSYDEDTLQFTFKPWMHHVGPLRVMGWRHANGSASDGAAVGKSLLVYLARHPATAKHIATKLCRRLVRDYPSTALVTSTAQVLTSTRGSIKPVLRHIVASHAFRTSSGRKVRLPVEMMVASLRATGARGGAEFGSKAAGGLLWRTHEMGNTPFGWHDPDGYPDTAAAWLSSVGVLSRWNTAVSLAQNWFDGLTVRSARSLAGGAARPTTAGPLIDALTKRICGQRFGAGHRAALLRFLGKSETSVVSDDELRWHGSELVALILSSPYMQLR